LIACARAVEREPEGLAALLARHYGVARQHDWPLAPLRLAALGVAPGDAYWLAADPVTLVAGRDDVRPAGTVRDLARADADRLIDVLNRHFAADGLAFVAPRPEAWFVRAPSPPRMITHALDAAAGRALRTLLPEGPDAASWRRWLGEIQMLFHDHPINVARERAGAASVNSVWFSGGGTMPRPAADRAPTRTWAHVEVVRALAAHAGSVAQPLPADLAPVLRHGRGGERLVVALDAPLDLAVVESAWGMPAWRALAAGKLESVTLLADGAGDALALRVPRPGLWARITTGVTTGVGTGPDPGLALLWPSGRLERGRGPR
jgi:hypothetical protein